MGKIDIIVTSLGESRPLIKKKKTLFHGRQEQRFFFFGGDIETEIDEKKQDASVATLIKRFGVDDWSNRRESERFPNWCSFCEWP